MSLWRGRGVCRAAVMAGLTKIPALLVDMPDQEAAVMALVENLQRRDLDFFEEAEGLARLLAEQNLTQEQAAATLGKTQSTIANKLRLLKLDPGLRAKIRKAGLTERHARALLRLPEELRETALSRILSQKLTVAATDRLVDRLLEPQPVPAPRKKAIVKDVRLFLKHGGSRPVHYENLRHPRQGRNAGARRLLRIPHPHPEITKRARGVLSGHAARPASRKPPLKGACGLREGL